METEWLKLVRYQSASCRQTGAKQNQCWGLKVLCPRASADINQQRNSSLTLMYIYLYIYPIKWCHFPNQNYLTFQFKQNRLAEVKMNEILNVLSGI